MMYFPWWYNFFTAAVVGVGVGLIYYFVPAIGIGLLGAIGYYILLDLHDFRMGRDA